MDLKQSKSQPEWTENLVFMSKNARSFCHTLVVPMLVSKFAENKLSMQFRIYQPLPGRTLSQELDDLLLQLYDVKTSFTRVYFSDVKNQLPTFERHPLAQKLNEGVVAYVEQPPLDGSKVALQTVEGDTSHFMFQTIRFDESEKLQSSEEQTFEAFEYHISFLHKQGLSLKDNCLRTWCFVHDIDRHYEGFISGRNQLFAREGLNKDSHFIASTGIGGSFACNAALVGIDFLSVDKTYSDTIRYLQAPEYLNRTEEYGVAFERGATIDVAGERYFFISGTASIDKQGNIVHPGDVVTQAGRLFLNIQELLKDGGGSLADLQSVIIYLRDIADYVTIDRYMRMRFPQLSFLIVQARVCRPGWLIEVEGVAAKSL